MAHGCASSARTLGFYTLHSSAFAEGRYGVSVYQPAAIVSVDLTA